MTEEQYENMMYALSMIITLLKNQQQPRPVPGINFQTVLGNHENIRHEQARETYKTITGNDPLRNRKIKVEFREEYN